MKRHKPKQYQYRMKRGFFLWPKWEEFKATNDPRARYIANNILEMAYFRRFTYRKLRLQKLVDGKWVDL